MTNRVPRKQPIWSACVELSFGIVFLSVGVGLASGVLMGFLKLWGWV